jgi:hypothetical protein
MWTPLSDRNARSIPLNLFSSDMVSVEIGSDDWLPTFRRGDVVTGTKHTGPTWHNLVGVDVIAETECGQRILGVLAPGRDPNTYDLRGFDPRHSGARDVRLAWAAPIRMIIRA